MTSAVTTQAEFAEVADDGSETGSTLGTADANWTQDADVPFRARFRITTADKDETDGFRIYANYNGTGYNQVTASSSNVQMDSSVETSWTITNGDATTQRLGSGTFVAGEYNEDAQTASMTIAAGEETELEFCMTIVSGDVVDANTILFEVRFDNGGALDGYTVRPTVTINLPAAGAIQQSHFRIRNEGALQTINQDSDWAAAIDVDATLDMINLDGGCLFGLRFEAEEISSGSKTITPKIQYRVNAGTWTDLSDVGTIDNYNDPGLSDSINNVIVVNKATITDGAATTNILSGSGTSFVAGTGEHNTVAASITLNNQHTEIEWRVLIRNRYTTRQESVTGDEYEFRMVESDNTILGGTYVIPKITINIPAGYMGGTGIETSQERSFIVIPDGTMYSCLEEGEQNAEFTMMKSIDGGDTWLQQDDTEDLSADMESLSMVYDDTNKVIHVMKIGASAQYYQYATKDHATVPDTWITANGTEIEASVDSNNQSCDIILRGSNIYVFFPDLSSTDQVWYRKKADLTTGSFGARVSIDTSGGSTDFTGVSAVLGPNSDLIHIFYTDYSNFVLYHVSLNTSDVLGTRHTCDGADPIKQGTSAEHGMTNAISWYNGSVEKAMVGYLDEVGDFLFTVTVEEDGTPDAPQNASNSVSVESNPAGVASKQPIATLGIDLSNNLIYAFYVEDTDLDLWLSTSDDGAAYTGHAEVQAAFFQSARGQVFSHSAGNGGDKVFGYIWDTGYDQDATARSGYSGTNRYDEYFIEAAPAGGDPVPQAKNILQSINRSATY